jgi:dihydrofolate synthase/folylpolyglutamate synthase
MAKTTKKTTKRQSRKSTSKTARVSSKRAFRTYDEAKKYLCERTDYEKESRVRYNKTTFNLSRMEKLLKLLGNPHKKIETVHIAGTKGKGSTATMLAKMLESNDYSVGLYTSPHVLDLHERIVVDSKKIGKTQMLKLINRIYSPVEKLSKDDPPSFFEIMTAVAFMHFVDEEVDIAVIETGLGGRLDSTNVIKPHVVGITSLSIDHQGQLGDSLGSIAAEKAGVFKRGVPIITVEQEPAAMKVLKSEALRMKAPFMVTGKDIDFSHRFETSREDGPHTRICLTTSSSKFEHLRVPLHGTHQAINCGLALAMLDKLKERGYDIDNEKAKRGLKEVSLAGRMEMISESPRIMIDAAHNSDSIRALMHAIGQNVPYDSMVVIFGCNVDKDIDGMLNQLQYGADKVIFTRSNSAKAAWPEDLGDRYNEICGKMYQTAFSLLEALRLAESAIGKEDLICITGSFYLIGQAKLMLSRNK